MSFRLRVIVLMTVLSLAPYIVTMIVMGNVYRDDYERRIRDNMTHELDITNERIEQSFQSLRKDMAFIASLDTMDDLLTGDLDKRITNLLVLKKNDMQLIGWFDVIDTDGNVVASSNPDRIATSADSSGLFSVPIWSSFDDNQLGQLTIHYSFENLDRFLPESEHSHYHLIVEDQQVTGPLNTDPVISVSRVLTDWPAVTVTLEQERQFAFSLLNSAENLFVIVLLVGIFVIASIAFFVATIIVKPILQLSGTAESITQTQDYSQRVAINRNDEIGQLSHSFNLMINGMQDMISRLKAENENRIKLAKEKDRAEMLQDLSTKLSRYLSPQIYESIFSGEQDTTLGSSRKKLTVFFSDIVDFTSTTDQMESEDLTNLLNQYLKEMSDIALRYGATIDKYIGDAIMIFFGDPKTLGVSEDAKACIEMALEMQRRVRELKSEWGAAGYSKPFSIRIGIHTGYCTVGNFGTENRLDYTIIGSAVNLASRIEGQAEPGTVFVSEDTQLLVRDHFSMTPTSTFTPKGFSQPIQLFRVISSGVTRSEIVIEESGFSLKLDSQELTEAGRQDIKTRLLNLIDDL